MSSPSLSFPLVGAESSSGSSSDSSLPSPRSEGPLSESEGLLRRPLLPAEAPTAASSSTSFALARSLGASVVGSDVHASFGGDLVQIARERTRRQEEDQKRQLQLRGAWARRSQTERPQEMQAAPSEDDSDFSSLSEASFHTPQRPPAYLASAASSSSSSGSGRLPTSPSSSSSASTSFARPSPSSLPFPSFYPPSGFQFGEGGPTPFAFSTFARPSQPLFADGGRLAPQAQLTEEALRRHTGQLGSDECGSSCDGHSSASCSCTGSVPASVAPSHSDDDHSICSCSVDTYSDSEFGSDCSDASDEELEANFHIAHEIDNVLVALRWANPVGWLGGLAADILVRAIPKLLAIPQRLPNLPIFRLKMRLPPLRLRRGESEQTVRRTAIVQPQ